MCKQSIHTEQLTRFGSDLPLRNLSLSSFTSLSDLHSQSSIQWHCNTATQTQHINPMAPTEACYSSSFEYRVLSIKTKVSSTKTRISSFKTPVSNFKTGVSSIKTRVSSIKNGHIRCFLLIQLKLKTRVLILETGVLILETRLLNLEF